MPRLWDFMHNEQWDLWGKKISCPCTILKKKKKKKFVNWTSNSFMTINLHQRLANAWTFLLPSQEDITGDLDSFSPTWLRPLFLPDCAPGSYKKLMKPVWTGWSNPCDIPWDPVWWSREAVPKFVFSFLVTGSFTLFCTSHAHLDVQNFPLLFRSSSSIKHERMYLFLVTNYGNYR